MQVAFYKSEDGDWVDLLIDGHKVWCAKYIAKYHLRRIKKYVSDYPIEIKEYTMKWDVDKEVMTVDGVEMPQLGYSEQEDFD